MMAALCVRARRARTIFEGLQGTAWHGRGREMCVGVGIEREPETMERGLDGRGHLCVMRRRYV